MKQMRSLDAPVLHVAVVQAVAVALAIVVALAMAASADASVGVSECCSPSLGDCDDTFDVSSDLPSDGLFVLTSFGGPTDGSTLGLSPACPGRTVDIDGTWYATSRCRWACGQRLRVTNPKDGRAVVLEVVDSGPALWVEEKAGRPILDADHAAARALFSVESAGWSSGLVVQVEEVADDTPLGPAGGSGDSANDTPALPSGVSSSGGTAPGETTAGGTIAPLSKCDVTCGFGTLECARPKPHLGVDLDAAEGTIVRAPCTGVVKEAEYHSGYAGTVLLQCDLGGTAVVHVLGHLSCGSTTRGVTCPLMEVGPGDAVTIGDKVAVVAARGENGGDWESHVHWGVHVGAYVAGETLCGDEWSYSGYTDCPKRVDNWVDPLRLVGSSCTGETSVATGAQIDPGDLPSTVVCPVAADSETLIEETAACVQLHGAHWWQKDGHGGTCWLTYAVADPTPTCWVTVNARIDEPGWYTFEMAVPRWPHLSAAAPFAIEAGGSEERGVIDLASNKGGWIALSSVYLSAGDVTFTLFDNSGEPYEDETSPAVVLDDLRIVPSPQDVPCAGCDVFAAGPLGGAASGAYEAPGCTITTASGEAVLPGTYVLFLLWGLALAARCRRRRVARSLA